MYPMDMEEFLFALVENTLVEEICKHFEDNKKIVPLYAAFCI